MMDPNLRNLKDFLGLYNQITELCFNRCVDNLCDRELNQNEDSCVSKCIIKFSRFNQRMMGVYVTLQQEINERRMLELQEQQKLAKQNQLQPDASY